ncbi:AAA family ATPase [Promicromonospora sp. NPDC050262]|uniref:helix-turn-helix transcriptional regulator n=1 Tax=Promicromonospora sp. NPDC050262 TaxID=3155036 RepID=UPI0033DB7BB4
METAAAPVGRDEELRRLATLLGGARNGRGGSLLVLGEPGIGKTCLLTAATRAPGLATIHLDGYESESTIPFAAVQRLVSLLREHCEGLPERQRQAVRVASGQADGPAPDRFLVGLGVLGLLAAAGARTPVVCVVDDAHLIDAESLDALAFVARRLAVENAAVVFAARDDGGFAERMGGVPRLGLTGLDPEAAAQLLNRSAERPLAPSAAAAIARATGGNPLALIDLAGDALVHELPDLGLGGAPVPVGRHLEEHYVRQVRRADPRVQTWVLLAAADSTGNIDLVTAAAADLGLGPDDGDRAEVAGLVELQPVVRFRHPLVRSAVYNAAPGAELRRMHGALARAAEGLGMVETEAWHAARTVMGTDPAVADRLAHTADLAARRGGLASRATILTRAAELTAPGPVRDARQVGAAEAALAVGAAHVAQRLVGEIDLPAVDPVTQGRALAVRTALSLFTADTEGVRGATAANLRAADAFHGQDAEREQVALLRAFESCCTAERLMSGVTLEHLGRRLAAGADLAGGPTSDILRGLGAVVLDPYPRAVAPARAALAAILALPDDRMMHMGTAIASLGTFLWDDAGRAAALDRAAQAARDSGALQVLDTLLWVMALSELWGGTLRRAVAYDELVREVRRAMGYDAENVPNVAVMAWGGAPRDVVRAIAEGAAATGFGGVEASAVASLAVRDLAEGGYQDAYERLNPLIADPFLQVTPDQYPDYVEAAARSGHPEEAARVARLLASLAEANGSPWCRGVAERALALAGTDEDAERHHVASVEALSGTRAEMDRARSHLVYGEWLRRARRRRDAAEQLRLALAHFHHSGAELFVARTVAELAAVGASGDVDAPPRRFGLTAQEHTVARLASAGHTNPEIAANLFISPSTVDYHLRKVFQKLGVTSRRQLADRLAAPPSSAPGATPPSDDNPRPTTS